MKRIKLIPLLWIVHQFALGQNVDYAGLEAVFGEPVTVSATGKPQRLSEAPVSMEIITAEQIQASGAMDLPQLLRQFAGIYVSRNLIGNADLNVRGYNQYLVNRLLILVNGRQVSFDAGAFTMWNSIPVQLSEIKQIEVVRGPKTALFGFNAASGAINIITYSPLDDTGDEARVRAGTQQWREASFVKRIRFSDQIAARISAGALESDGFDRDRFGPGISSEDAMDQRTVNLDAYWRLSDRASFRFEAGYVDQALDATVPYASLVNLRQKTKYGKLEYAIDSGRSGVWRLSAYRNDMESLFDVNKFTNGEFAHSYS